MTTEPWVLSRAHHAQAHAAGLFDDDILHAMLLSSYFGHLNRIADAVAVPLDYDVQLPVPATDPSVPALAASPVAVTGRVAIELSRRPTTAQALAAWRTYIFDRDAPLPRRQRTVLARWVSSFLGDGGISTPQARPRRGCAVRRLRRGELGGHVLARHGGAGLAGPRHPSFVGGCAS